MTTLLVQDWLDSEPVVVRHFIEIKKWKPVILQLENNTNTTTFNCDWT